MLPPNSFNTKPLVPTVVTTVFFPAQASISLSFSPYPHNLWSRPNPSPLLYTNPPVLHGWDLPQDITSLLKRVAEHSRCLLLCKHPCCLTWSWQWANHHTIISSPVEACGPAGGSGPGPGEGRKIRVGGPLPGTCPSVSHAHKHTLSRSYEYE